MSATAAVRPRSPDSIAARRTSAAGHRRGACHGVGHEAAERTLAQLADEQAPEEVGFGRRGALEDAAQDLLTGGGRTASRRRLELVEGAVDVGDRERRRDRRRDVEPRHGRPPDADASLARLADQEPDDGLDLVGGEPGPARRPAPRSSSIAPASRATASDVATRSANSTAPRLLAYLRAAPVTAAGVASGGAQCDRERAGVGLVLAAGGHDLGQRDRGTFNRFVDRVRGDVVQRQVVRAGPDPWRPVASATVRRTLRTRTCPARAARRTTLSHSASRAGSLQST